MPPDICNILYANVYFKRPLSVVKAMTFDRPHSKDHFAHKGRRGRAGG